MYYLCNFCEADLRLCFRIYANGCFSDAAVQLSRICCQILCDGFKTQATKLSKIFSCFPLKSPL